MAYAEFKDFFPETAWSAWMDNISNIVHSETGLILIAVESGKIVGVIKFYPNAASSNLGQWPPKLLPSEFWQFIPLIGVGVWADAWYRNVSTAPPIL